VRACVSTLVAVARSVTLVCLERASQVPAGSGYDNGFQKRAAAMPCIGGALLGRKMQRIYMVGEPQPQDDDGHAVV
jgi:hypothetical protein